MRRGGRGGAQSAPVEGAHEESLEQLSIFSPWKFQSWMKQSWSE
jgi:hypothetical protein